MVGRHELTAEEPIIELNATRGKRLEYTRLPNIIKLDKQPLVQANVSSITADGLPPWLSFDEKSWKVSGTPDTKARPANVTIAVVDKFFDILNVTLAVNFHTPVFVSDVLAPADTQITVETRPESSWVRFDDSSKILSGTAPDIRTSDSANGIRVALNSTQRRTKDKEVKNMSIHVIAANKHSQAGNSKPGTKGDDSRRDLYWLLVIPVMLAAITIILVIFRVRKRRHQPRKLDFSEVSGPVPGSFVANSFAGVTFDAIRKTLDMGPHAPLPRQNGYAPTVDSGQRSQASVNPTIEIDDVTPHALTHSEAIKPAHQAKASTGKRDSWLTTRQGRPSPAGSDEISLLSDETFRAEVHTAQEVRSSRTQKPGEIFYGKKTAPDAPATAEPFSIQPTPELAYTAAKRYDFVSDDETPPTVGYAARRGSVRRQNQSPSHHGVQHRLSKAWKLGSPSKLLSNVKRHSHLSSSTNETTRTSILSSGVSKEATTASANVVTKPTVILIPSRPGEARQVSRRTEDSVSFFGGGSLTRSHRNFGLEKDTASEHPPRGDLGLSSGIREPDGVRDGATVWDPLGIAYQDLQTKRTTKELVANPEKPRMGSIQSENWSTYPTHESLMSPSRWPIPDAFIGLGGTPDVFRNPNEPPQVPPPKLPATAKLPGTLTHIIKNSAGGARRPSRESGSMSSLSQTPSTTHKRSKSRSPHEERLRISRIREQRALDEFRAMMESQTPSPSGEWAAPRAGQAPETPSRTGRAPLADRPNGSGGLKSSLSKRSVKTVRSAKSVRSAWVGEDDDDAWEDVLPPQSMIGEWERAESDGSFPVYI
ncbi:hypothetical protein F4802DRAFT_552178 [Xylaria palmicola]|nr:hypothetical protein F4802DRAFT_552178 [Xylaria palmicola]